jgi:hypothetical protein
MNRKNYFLLLLPFIAQSTFADWVLFQQSPELLSSNQPIEGQSIIGMGEWQLRGNDLSPFIDNFAGSKSIVTSPQVRAREVVIAHLQLETTQRWTADIEFVLEFEVAIDNSDNDALAAVGIGWTGGGIPTHAGIIPSRFFIRQRHFGDFHSAFEADGTFFQPQMKKWYKVQTVWRKDFEDSVPSKMMTVIPVDEENDAVEFLFGEQSFRSSSLPAADPLDADSFQFMNLIWLRVQGQSAIRNITLFRRERR